MAIRTLSQRPDGHTFLSKFSNGCILLTNWVYLHQTWAFCKAWSALYDYVNQWFYSHNLQTRA